MAFVSFVRKNFVSWEACLVVMAKMASLQVNALFAKFLHGEGGWVARISTAQDPAVHVAWIR